MVSSFKDKIRLPHGFLEYLRWTGLCSVCLLPIFLVVGSGPSDVAASLIALLFLVVVVTGQSTRVPKRFWFVSALVFWGFMLITAPLAAVDPGNALSRASTFIRFPMFAAGLGLWLLADPVWRKRYVLIMAIVLIGVAAFTLVEWYWVTQVSESYSRPLRLYGPFDGRKVGIFLTKTMFPCLGLAAIWAAEGSPRRLWAFGAGIVLLLLVIFLSGERSALLLACLGLLIFALAIQLPRIRRFMLCAAAGMAMALPAAYTMFPGKFERQVVSTAEALSGFQATAYGFLWRSGIEVGAVSPLVGVGGKNFRDVCPQIRPENIPLNGDYFPEVLIFCSTHPHNIYIEVFAEYGLIGSILFVVMLSGLAVAFRGQRSDPIALGAGIGALIIVWPLVPHGSFFTNWNGIIFWSLIGLMLSRSRKQGGATLCDRSVTA